MNLYEIMHPIFRFTKNKTIHVFETFAGVGAQAKALENLNINFRICGISEIDKDAVVSYAAIHCSLNEKLQNFEFPSKEKMISVLQRKDVGFDFKTGRHTINKRTNIEKLKKYYLADKLSNNFGNISKVHAKDIPETHMLTYSFPCQDLSKAGRMKGMDKDANTRSGLLWEIERILDEAVSIDKLPQVLVMENVPEVIGTRNKKNFMLWFDKLESLGYQSYFKIVDSRHFGIPQHRERCFMISILGNYSYSFPKGFKLETRVIDHMQDVVDYHHFLSQKMIDKMTGADKDEKRKIINYYVPDESEKLNEICCLNGMIDGKRVSQTNRILDSRGIGVTITCGYTGYYAVPASQYIDKKKIGYLDHRVVRGLSVLEAFRLMGFEDEDVEKMKEAQVSERQMFRQAGNSIVVNVLEALFCPLFE